MPEGKKFSAIDSIEVLQDTDELLVGRGNFISRVFKSILLSALQPPSGKCRITGFYVDPTIERLIIEYDDTPMP